MVGTRVATVSDRSEADLFQSLLVRLLPPSLPEVSLPLLLRCHAEPVTTVLVDEVKRMVLNEKCVKNLCDFEQRR